MQSPQTIKNTMKKIYLILISFILIFTAQAQTQEIIGTSQNIEEGDIVRITFGKDGYTLLKLNNETIGGPSYKMDGEEVSLSYELDTARSPYWIDFRITIKSDGSQFDMMLGILEFSDDFTEMKICLDFDEGSKKA